MKPEIIAFYLPQYHPTENNNKWWGEGFTEWTNVAKAKKYFPNHYQPKVPSDLGFYDLRLPDVRKKQAELAKEAGITGFCYYHYWFGNGHEELELPFNEVVQSGEPDFPFCLCWANETWSKKFWNKDGDVAGKTDLAIQQYLGDDDDIAHFYRLLPAFRDDRYIKIDGKPIFVIYSPLKFAEADRFIALWNRLAKENGFSGFHFVGYTYDVKNEYKTIINLGFDAVCACRLRRHSSRNISWAFRKLLNLVTRIPECYNYKKIYHTFIGREEKEFDNVIPTMLPNWDHTPRSGRNGYLFTNSTPQLFKLHAEEVLKVVTTKSPQNQIAFIKSWNEWGEGNYMEPDLRFGKGYIKALNDAIKNIKNETSN